ncbi:MAG TPA: hypothetical protein VHP33_14975 [Polyangiaceae bacterium]|nr:hypothetical protein [Polyangiaceae bacterium]
MIRSNLALRLGLLLVTLPAGVLAQPAPDSPEAPKSEAPKSEAPKPEAPKPEAPALVSLRYTNELGCPSEAEFVDEVSARVRRPVQWTKSDRAIQIVVIVRAGERATGTLEVTQSATEPTRREFSSSSCAEVGSALALVTALTLDPNARTEQLPTHGAASSAPTSALVVQEPPPPVAIPATAPAAPKPAVVPPPPVTAPSNGFVAWLGPAASVGLGYVSEPLISVGLSLGARSPKNGWSPGFQLTPMWGGTGETGPTAAEGAFSWAMGRLEGCPLRLALAEPLSFEPCVAAEIGRVSARGTAAEITPVSVERWWFAAGATFSLHFSRGAWFARAGALLLVPATRDEFVFRAPDRTIQKASPGLVGGTLALGFQFGS